jgi:hypothetical protein
MFRCITIATALISLSGLPANVDAQGATACWMVFGEQRATYGRSDADEVICLKSPISGEVIESSIFGSVGGCSAVSVNREGSATTFVLDFAKCSISVPKHSISCPSLTGETPKCAWKWSDNSLGQAYLRSCPVQWCSHPRDYGAK